MTMFSPFGAVGRYLARAVSLAGLGQLDEYFYDPMAWTMAQMPVGGDLSVGGWRTPPSSAPLAGSTAIATRGGVNQVFTSGGPASVVMDLYAESAGALVADATTERWYVGTRFRLFAGLSATNDAAIGLGQNDQAVILRIGGNGYVSTGFYSLTNGPAGTSDKSATSTVAIDTNYHIFEMWSAANNNVRWAIDGVEQTAFGTTELADGHPFIVVTEPAASAVLRGLEVDDVFYMFQGAP